MSEPMKICATLARASGGPDVPLIANGAPKIGGAFIVRDAAGSEIARIPGHLVEPLGRVFTDLADAARRKALDEGYRRLDLDPERLHLRAALTVMMPDPSDRNTWRWAISGRSHAPVSACAAETRADFPVDSVCRTAHLALSVPHVFAKARSVEVEGMIEV